MMEDLILMMALLINAILWSYSMMSISWFRLVFLSFFDAKHDKFFEDNTIFRSIECSAVSASFLVFWALSDKLNLYIPLLGAFCVYWFLSYHYRNFQILKVCKYTLKEYMRIEVLINKSRSLAYDMPYLDPQREEQAQEELHLTTVTPQIK